MGGVEAGIGVSGGVGGDDRQIAHIGEVDQRLLRRLLDRVTAADQLDVEPLREQRLQMVEIGFGLVDLPIGDEPRQRALGACGERDQAVARFLERRESNMRVFADGTVEVGRRHERAQVRIARVILGQQHQPVEAGLAADFGRPRHR